jgi:hypothetical protein
MAARAEVRAQKGAAGVYVNLRGGVYSCQTDGGVLLPLTAADSGAPGAPVVWRAHPGEDVLLSAGLHIPAASFKPRPGHAGQLQANLTALGIEDLGQLGR